MKVALIQIDSGADKEANFKKAQKYIGEALARKPDIVCLSENFLYVGEDRAKEAENISSNFISAFQELARAHKVNFILGSIALKTQTQKTTNSCLVLNRQGEIIHRYDKMYMYDVMRSDLNFRESDVVQPGSKIGFFELDNVKMGVGICVDLRYPEYFRALTKLGAEVVFLPANFRKLTGERAWDILTQARAIENQIYFCACGQTGGSGVKERCGNSRLVSFAGEVVSAIDQAEGVVYADLDLAALRAFRKEFPVLQQMK